MNIHKNGKKIITALLLVSCIVSGIILMASPTKKIYRLQNTQQLDSLLNLHFKEANILDSHIRTAAIQVDSNLLRKEYRIIVPSRFSKTMFHATLHKTLYSYDVSLPARVHLPSHDMNIYIYYQDTILRTLRLTTDTDLDSLHTQAVE